MEKDRYNTAKRIEGEINYVEGNIISADKCLRYMDEFSPLTHELTIITDSTRTLIHLPTEYTRMVLRGA